MDHRPLWLLQRLQELLPVVLVPVYPVRTGGRGLGQGHDILWSGRPPLLFAAACRGGCGPVPLHLHLHLPSQAPGGVRPAAGAVRRLLRPHVVRAMRHLPDVPGAQEQRRRPGHGMGSALEKDDYGSCTNARHDALTTATRSPSKPGLRVAYMHSLCVMWLCQQVNGSESMSG
uniref:Uncharacterized protein n=1 Tax=Zea mays TaxID=4577 RepID=A0A804LPD6_MAIZE